MSWLVTRKWFQFRCRFMEADKRCIVITLSKTIHHFNMCCIHWLSIYWIQTVVILWYLSGIFRMWNNLSAFYPPLKSSGQLWGQGSICGLRALPRGPQCFQDLNEQIKFCTITTTLNHNTDCPLLFFPPTNYQANQVEIAKHYKLLKLGSIASHH